MANFIRAALLLALSGSMLAQQSLRLVVVDSQGAAVPGATVYVGDSAVLTTAVDGTVTIDAVPPVTVRITSPGFATEIRRLTGTDGEEVKVALRPEPVYSTVNVMVRREELSTGPVEASSVLIDRTGARTVLDAVDQLVPSAFVTRRSMMGYGISSAGTGGVTIRGVGNSPNTGVLVLVDGRPDYMGLMGHPLPDFYSLPDAETVSVTEGPASVLYGSNAMGGVVDIKPIRPTEGFQTELSTSLGSYWTGQHRLKHGAGFERWFYHLTAGADHTNGHRPVSHYRNQDATFATGVDLARGWRTGLRGRYGHFVVEDPGAVTAAPGDWAAVGRGGFGWNLDNTAQRIWGTTRVFGSWGHHHIMPDGWRSNDRTVGAHVHQNFLVRPAVLVDVGGDLVDYGGDGRNAQTGLDYGHHFGTSAAGFGRVHWTPSPGMKLHAGLRHENNSIFGGITVPEAGASFGLGRNLSLGVGVSRGFRNPTIRELYLFPAPNPLLEPEQMWSYQASLDFQPSNSFAASLTGYYADLDNIIVVTGRYPNLALTNGGRALNRGLSTNARWRLTRRVAVRGGYAYLRSTNRVPYIPSHKGTYQVELNLDKAFVYVGGVTIGSRWANAAHTAEMDGYTVPTLKLMVPVDRNWTLFATLDNVFNQDYQVVPGYPMPGANAIGGVTVSF